MVGLFPVFPVAVDVARATHTKLVIFGEYCLGEFLLHGVLATGHDEGVVNRL